MKKLASAALCLVLVAILSPHEANAQWHSRCSLPVPTCKEPLFLTCFCDQKGCTWQCIPFPHG